MSEPEGEEGADLRDLLDRRSPFRPADAEDEDYGLDFRGEDLRGSIQSNVALLINALTQQWLQRSTPTEGLLRSQLDRLTSLRRITESDLKTNIGQCTICLSEYQKGEEARTLPCWHLYHRECIDRWLKEHRTCPICKADVTELADEAEVLSKPELARPRPLALRRKRTRSPTPPPPPPPPHGPTPASWGSVRGSRLLEAEDRAPRDDDDDDEDDEDEKDKRNYGKRDRRTSSWTRATHAAASHHFFTFPSASPATSSPPAPTPPNTTATPASPFPAAGPGTFPFGPPVDPADPSPFAPFPAISPPLAVSEATSS
eukprot:EG_transcript_20714